MTTNPPPSREVAELAFDQLLQEQLSDTPAPDVTQSIAKALGTQPLPRRGRRRANARWAHPRLWIQAACILLGVGVVIAIRSNTTTEPEAKPAGQRMARQDPTPPRPALPPPVVVDSLDAIAALPADTQNVRLSLYTADAVQGLARLRQLVRLDASFDLEGVWNTDAIERPEFFPGAATPLGQLTSLEELDLSGHAPLTGLAPLATLAHLRYLRIEQAKIDPPSLALLTKLPALTHLAFRYNVSTDEEKIHLDFTHPDYDLKTIAGACVLRHLDLGVCITDAAGLRALASLPLETLHVYALMSTERDSRGRGGDLSPKDYVPLAGIPSLRELGFGDHLGPDMLAALPKMVQLETLHLSSATGLKGAAAQAIAELPNLKTLHLTGTDADNAGVSAMLQAKSLEELVLGHNHNGGSDEHLELIAQMPALQRLELHSVDGATDSGLALLADLPLEKLSIRSCNQFTAAGMTRLPKSLRALVVDSKLLSPAALASFPKLTDLSITFYNDEPQNYLADVHASPLRTSLTTLRLGAELAGIDNLEKLLGFPALKLIDGAKLLDPLPAPLAVQLREQGIEVRQPKPPTPQAEASAAAEANVIEIIEEQGGGGK